VSLPPHLVHLLIRGGLYRSPENYLAVRTIDDDLQSLNFGVHTAWRKKARDRCVASSASYVCFETWLDLPVANDGLENTVNVVTSDNR